MAEKVVIELTILEDEVIGRWIHPERPMREFFGAYLEPWQLYKVAAAILGRVPLGIPVKGYREDGAGEETEVYAVDNLSTARKEWDRKRRDLSPKVFARDGAHCAFCGSEEDLEIDHMVPLSRGGPSDLDNLQVLCGGCNRIKGSK